MVLGSLKIVVPGISSLTQLICKRVGLLSQLQCTVWSQYEINKVVILNMMKRNTNKFFLGLVRGCNVYILFAQIFLQVDTHSLLFKFSCSNPFPRGICFLYIVSPNASKPSTYTSQGRNWDACPIKTLLEVVESVVSCGTTVQLSFLHKCDQLSWCSVLNVEVMAIFPIYFLSYLLAHLWCLPWYPTF